MVHLEETVLLGTNLQALFTLCILTDMSHLVEGRFSVW